MQRTVAIGAILLVALAGGCAKGPPREPDDACAIFGDRRGWWEAAREARERWGVPESTQLAFIHQESRFRHDSRPPRTRLLWVIPWKRRSSAFGYGQVTDGTWSDYQRRTGNRGADRDDFEDVVDFIGWYGHVIHRTTGIPKTDAYRLYLAYHEGPAGYRRGSHARKPWLHGVAQRVAARAGRYERQVTACRDSLGRKRFWLF
jgi:hypothetical protein